MRLTLPLYAPSKMLPQVIAVIGATGTGKSNLAVTLASRLNGVIINADAMQMYKGLPIITNKIPEEERNGIPHHMLDSIGLEEHPWTVSLFKQRAQQLIEEIQAQGKRPIVVGGTLYYVQALLLKDSLAETEEAQYHHENEHPILEGSTEDMLAKLREVDPIMADRWHPQDRRKIRRSLEIFLTTGRRASELYSEQAGRSSLNGLEDADGDGGRQAYDSLIFWTYADLETLKPRLDARVDTMVTSGLVEEVQSLYDFVQQNPGMDFTRGIGVSIGYKEFLPYLDALKAGNVNDTIKEECVERTKISTKQYSRNQIRWIRRKLLPTFHDVGLASKIFLLDVGDGSDFHERVEKPALEIATAFYDGKELPDPLSLVRDDPSLKEMLSLGQDIVDISRTREIWVRRTCELCNVTAVLEPEWTRHVGGRKHRNAVRKEKKWLENPWPRRTKESNCTIAEEDTPSSSR